MTDKKMYAYPPGTMGGDRDFYVQLSERVDERALVRELTVDVRSGEAWEVGRGQIFRVVAIDGPQVGDFNAWSLHNPREHLWAARTRLMHRAHVSTLDRLWSSLPYLRPMMTITQDTVPSSPDRDGGARCHDLLGSRCDPYLYKLVDGRDFHQTCHNNLTRAIARYHLTEMDTHDPLNIFQATGLDEEDHYFAVTSPAREGDFVEFFAEIDLLCAISSCPGGDLSIPPRGPERGDPEPTCKRLGVEIYDVDEALLEGWRSPSPVHLDSVY